MKAKPIQVIIFSLLLLLYVSFVVLQSRSTGSPNTAVKASFEPEVLNLKSEGHSITCFLEVIENNRRVNDINVSSIRLMDSIPVNQSRIEGKRLMVKFDKTTLIDLLNHILQPEPYVKFKELNLKIVGSFDDGTLFVSFDKIRVILI